VKLADQDITDDLGRLPALVAFCCVRTVIPPATEVRDDFDIRVCLHDLLDFTTIVWPVSERRCPAIMSLNE